MNLYYNDLLIGTYTEYRETSKAIIGYFSLNADNLLPDIVKYYIGTDGPIDPNRDITWHIDNNDIDLTALDEVIVSKLWKLQDDSLTIDLNEAPIFSNQSGAPNVVTCILPE